MGCTAHRGVVYPGGSSSSSGSNSATNNGLPTMTPGKRNLKAARYPATPHLMGSSSTVDGGTWQAGSNSPSSATALTPHRPPAIVAPPPNMVFEVASTHNLHASADARAIAALQNAVSPSKQSNNSVAGASSAAASFPSGSASASSRVGASTPAGAADTPVPFHIRRRRLPSQTHVSWRMCRPLGRGAHGKVYLAVDTVTGALMACKEVELLHVRQDRRANVVDSVNAEVGVMRQLEHTNIVKFLGCRPREGKLYIFSEWMSGGSLASIVKNIGALDEALVQHYVRDILRGLVAVHQADFVHGDIKPGNVLLGGDGTAKLTDFGATRVCAKPEERSTVIMGTPLFLAPEVIRGEPGAVRPSSDIWSVGCTAIHLATGEAPWSSANFKSPTQALLAIASRNKPPPIPDSASPALRAFIQRCCCVNVAHRPSATELLSDPFLAPVVATPTRGPRPLETPFASWSMAASKSVVNAVATNTLQGTTTTGLLLPRLLSSSSVSSDDGTARHGGAGAGASGSTRMSRVRAALRRKCQSMQSMADTVRLHGGCSARSMRDPAAAANDNDNKGIGFAFHKPNAVLTPIQAGGTPVASHTAGKSFRFSTANSRAGADADTDFVYDDDMYYGGDGLDDSWRQASGLVFETSGRVDFHDEWSDTEEDEEEEQLVVVAMTGKGHDGSNTAMEAPSSRPEFADLTVNCGGPTPVAQLTVAGAGAGAGAGGGAVTLPPLQHTPKAPPAEPVDAKPAPMQDMTQQQPLEPAARAEQQRRKSAQLQHRFSTISTSSAHTYNESLVGDATSAAAAALVDDTQRDADALVQAQVVSVGDDTPAVAPPAARRGPANAMRNEMVWGPDAMVQQQRMLEELDVPWFAVDHPVALELVPPSPIIQQAAQPRKRRPSQTEIALGTRGMYIPK